MHEITYNINKRRTAVAEIADRTALETLGANNNINNIT